MVNGGIKIVPKFIVSFWCRQSDSACNHDGATAGNMRNTAAQKRDRRNERQRNNGNNNWQHIQISIGVQISAEIMKLQLGHHSHDLAAAHGVGCFISSAPPQWENVNHTTILASTVGLASRSPSATGQPHKIAPHAAHTHARCTCSNKSRTSWSRALKVESVDANSIDFSSELAPALLRNSA